MNEKIKCPRCGSENIIHLIDEELGIDTLLCVYCCYPIIDDYHIKIIKENEAKVMKK